MRVVVGSENPAKLRAVERAFRYAFGRVELKGIEVDSGIPPQPLGFSEILKGAFNRAREAKKHGDFGVGIEAGGVERFGRIFDHQVCVVITPENEVSLGVGAGFILPDEVEKRVKERKEMGEVMSEVSGIREIGKKIGAIGYLSKGALTRVELTYQAVIAALIPIVNKDLYSLPSMEDFEMMIGSSTEG